MGPDLCSPARNKTSDNTRCHSACREEQQGNQHYKCATTHDNSVNQHCGNWDISDVSKKAMEYDDKNRVCAGPCHNLDGDMVCKVVEWEWDE